MYVPDWSGFVFLIKEPRFVYSLEVVVSLRFTVSSVPFIIAWSKHILVAAAKRC